MILTEINIIKKRKMEETKMRELSQVEFGELAFKIKGWLELSDRKAILKKLGFPPGTVDTNAKDWISFLAWLHVQDLFHRKNMNLPIWQDYPEVLKLIVEATK